jgi:glycosyltransferase involved in cell wall biosynthesis
VARVRVLLASKFLHHVGGVETYLRWQAGALVEAGHEVALLGMTPPPGERIMTFPPVPIYLTPERSFDPGAPNRARSAAASVYSPRVGAVFREAVAEFRPDVVHFHGTCYQLTSSVFREARRSNARIFLTAHEYKLVCANYSLFDDRRQEICTDCVEQTPLGKSVRILRRSCIKGSLGPSLLGAIEMPVSLAMWRSCDGHVLAPSRFMAEVLLRDGVPGTVEYLENPWPQLDPPSGDKGRNSILFMARLVPEKGVRIVLQAWASIVKDHPDVRLRIAGKGPEEAWIRDFVYRYAVERVDVLGVLNAEAVRAELDRALLTVHPSVWYENSPLSVRESLCAGVPAAVSDLGGNAEAVGGARGPVLPAADHAAWATAMAGAVKARLAGSQRLVDAVRERWFSEEEHLARLEVLYSGSTKC